jgi:hypothetical protein
MYSGLGQRNEAHAERKFYAVEAIEHDRGQHNVPQMVIRASTSVENDGIWHGRRLTMRAGHIESAVWQRGPIRP